MRHRVTEFPRSSVPPTLKARLDGPRWPSGGDSILRDAEQKYSTCRTWQRGFRSNLVSYCSFLGRHPSDGRCADVS